MMNHSVALLSLMKHNVDVISCECNGKGVVKVHLRSGELFTGASFEYLVPHVIDQSGSREPSEPSEMCRNLELAIEDWKSERLQMELAAFKSLVVKAKKKL